MRSFILALILFAGVGTTAHAQNRLTAPIAKAREAAAHIMARNKQGEGQDTAHKRDSVPSTTASANAPAVQKPANASPAGATSKPPALPPATSAASKTAAAKPDTTPKGATVQKPSSPKTADTTKAAPGKSGTATTASGSDKSVATVPPPQAVPGKGTPANTKAPAPAPGGKAPVTPGTSNPSATVGAGKDVPPPPTTVSSTSSSRPEIAINREVFQYDQAGRRDPFASLLMTSDLRPLFSDLLLVVINYDPQGRNSVAIMRDATTKEQYRVRQGQLIGRMRVAAIEPKRVMFTIDEFGFSRQESLVIGDTTKVRKQ
jgi:hypothetical protein